MSQRGTGWTHERSGKMHHVDDGALERSRAQQTRRAGKCRCGAEMQYIRGGKVCVRSRMPSDRCPINPNEGIIQALKESAEKLVSGK